MMRMTPERFGQIISHAFRADFPLTWEEADMLVELVEEATRARAAEEQYEKVALAQALKLWPRLPDGRPTPSVRDPADTDRPRIGIDTCVRHSLARTSDAYQERVKKWNSPGERTDIKSAVDLLDRRYAEGKANERELSALQLFAALGLAGVSDLRDVYQARLVADGDCFVCSDNRWRRG